MHSRESIQALLATNDKAVCRALVVLFEHQTDDEQQADDTVYRNKMGFNATDAKFGTSLAKQILEWEKNKKYPNPLSPNQLGKARQMVKKYAQQLANVANLKLAA